MSMITCTPPHLDGTRHVVYHTGAGIFFTDLLVPYVRVIYQMRYKYTDFASFTLGKDIIELLACWHLRSCHLCHLAE